MGNLCYQQMVQYHSRQMCLELLGEKCFHYQNYFTCGGTRTRTNYHFALFRYFDENGKVFQTSEFDSGCKHHLSGKQGSFELFGDRLITLGTNM
jgi:hypothetical protein